MEDRRAAIEAEEQNIQAEERQAKLEAEERRAQIALEKRKMEMEKAKMEFDLRALEINARSRPPPDSQSTFTVETAAKRLPELASEQELEVYLITFRKIASLNNWPKSQRVSLVIHCSMVLQR